MRRAAHARTPQRSKYGAVRCEYDGHKFASKREMRVYQDLKLQERAGQIRCIKLQPRFALDVNGVHVCDYIGDFDYFDVVIQARVVADAKGFKNRVYELKRKLMYAVHGITIQEL